MPHAALTTSSNAHHKAAAIHVTNAIPATSVTHATTVTHVTHVTSGNRPTFALAMYVVPLGGATPRHSDCRCPCRPECPVRHPSSERQPTF